MVRDKGCARTRFAEKKESCHNFHPEKSLCVKIRKLDRSEIPGLALSTDVTGDNHAQSPDLLATFFLSLSLARDVHTPESALQLNAFDLPTRERGRVRSFGSSSSGFGTLRSSKGLPKKPSQRKSCPPLPGHTCIIQASWREKTILIFHFNCS